VIPFVFAMYPELLLIEDAVIDPSAKGGEVVYLPGYDGTVDWGALAILIPRIGLALFLLASALAAYDRARLAAWEVVLRLGLAALVVSGPAMIYGPAAVVAMIWLVLHMVRARDDRDDGAIPA